MMSLRAIARAAPRTVGRLTSSALRQSSVARTSSLLRATSFAPVRASQFTSAFSTTPFRRASEGEVDEELSVKLESEIQFEADMKENEELPSSVKDFLENSPFTLTDTPGKEEVTLTRTFGNETITVSFSISDLTNYEPDMYNEDAALADEELEASEAEQRALENDGEDDLDDDSADAAVPCRLNVVVEKPGKGALNIEAIAQDGQILVENFYYYKDAKLAHASDAELAHQAQDAYPGPPFGSLDEDLQVLMERYLEERGVTQALAVFVPDYMDIKEQNEYQAWLKDVKGFIDA